MNQTDNSGLPNSVIAPLTGTLTTNDRRATESPDEVRNRTELETQKALDAADFGKFNYKVTLIAGLICVNATFSIVCLGFIIPSAACDFDMDTVAKGRISNSLIAGMICGLFLWGWVGDTMGRKRALQGCLILQASSEFAALIVSNYWGYLFFKFFSGLAESGLLTIVYTYLGEFQPTKQREKVLGLMQIPFVIGCTLSPICAWIVIPLDIELKFWFISFKSWNLLILIGAIFPLLIALPFWTLPETPKFLAEIGRCTELFGVLAGIYRQNTGNTTEEYLAKLTKARISLPTDRTVEWNNGQTVNKKSATYKFRDFVSKSYGHVGDLFKRPYLGRTLNLGISTYLTFSALYSLMVWFPEIFHRFAEFERKHPGETSNICIVSVAGAKQAKITTCDNTIETAVFVNSLLLGLAGVPTTIVFVLTVARLGFKFFTAFNSFTCGIVTVGLIFVTSSMQNMILSCVFASLMTITLAVLHCQTVELYPTHLRVSATALASLLGRVGAFVGNLTFGYLIDYHCYLLISIVAVELFVTGILSLFLTQGEHGVKWSWWQSLKAWILDRPQKIVENP